jgi:hypothetical protein
LARVGPGEHFGAARLRCTEVNGASAAQGAGFECLGLGGELRQCGWGTGSARLEAANAQNRFAARAKIGLRGGVNAFARYENGKTKPPLALVKLLKVTPLACDAARLHNSVRRRWRLRGQRQTRTLRL